MLSMKPGAVARYAPNEDGKGQNARIQEIWPIYGIQSCPFFGYQRFQWEYRNMFDIML